jgi:predicted amidohydrolase
MSNEPVAATVRVAVVQRPAVLGDVAANLRSALAEIAAASLEGVDLLVFPECYLSGYMFSRRDQARAAAIPITDPAVGALAAACAEGGVHVVMGLLEHDGAGSTSALYNSALTIGPSGLLGRYRKQHLPFLAVDRFVEPGGGHEARVVETPIGRIGTMICFDLRFPESARELALQGADIVAVPTNWPASATVIADHLTRARALENLVYLAVADRADTEAGTQFLGRSQIVGPTGEVLVDAGDDPDTRVAADLDLAVARRKDLILVPGEYELSIFGSRRPDLYGEITRLPPEPS